MKHIISTQNREIKEVVKLHNKNVRQEQNKFIIEGIRAIETALPKLKLDKVFVTENNLKLILKLIISDQVILVPENVMDKISAANTPPGILAIFFIPEQPDLNKLSTGVVLADLRDPGNMGTLIRTAAACNLKTIVVIEGTDIWSPKVIQSSAGTIALVNIFNLSWQDLVKHKKNLKLYALVVSNGKSIKAVTSQNALLVVGSEANGIPDNWLKDCEEQITLPMQEQTESLNAAIAGSIAIYLTFCKI